ncbi:UNVERIFIED_CONTAM: hypothetical protein Sradi_2089100 [Sesamum radiatum]|uniref:DUF4283 domain-containing protein n=1 Tax=Sesamum radiatum TaxID=300843 RepID=A0AAW2TIX7_SESRA
MYLIERYLSTLKSYVRNRSRLEGFIAEVYLMEESLTFCSTYLEDVETKFNKVKRNDDNNEFTSVDVRSGFSGEFSVRAINIRHVFIKFALEEEYTKVWLKSIWFVDGFPMWVFKWTLIFNPREESPIVSVWVRLPKLPIQFFYKEALFSIDRLLGTPLQTDVSTATLVQPSVARVCVEINLLEPLQTEVGLGLGTEMFIQPCLSSTRSSA